MQKILIIGNKGMLGQELVNVFKKDKDYKVIAWDREDIDISREKEVAKKIGFTKPNIIINAAAYNAVDKCEENKKEYKLALEINGKAPGYLAKSAKKNKAVLVHYSTDYVFNGEPEIPEPAGCSHSCATCSLHQGFQPEVGFDETAKPSPISNYGKSKLIGEKEVAKNTKSYYIIRTSKIFGKPAISDGAKKSFFDVMLELGKKNKIVKVIDEETSCFTYAPDLAKKTKEMLDAKKPFGIYHIVNSGPCTWYEAVVELYCQAKIKTKIIPVEGKEFPRPAKRPFYSVLVNTKLNPMRSWKEALQEYLNSVNSEQGIMNNKN
ncbi:MAG: dTDP-4-dehydrorhamnose reductase [Candidatus Moranbacteria bacterium RIFOXYA12_FULL_35_19]|nr:MAG: dTDP-4-dehydrorhamnose reductase [Candidatus Moranbacteria bacterium GW2011_GWF2_35_39]OGI31897.1 MAG: dTDP-4-dehydrorhamnose reductase [Candidatus Moranbacteria bacterium RIFOXYB12_FULL_35_8]OGI32331.1 MAG: dTDP-4-dehydrorhamnose reductase [Candidatus Moranbacteria bacterium RIFOXYC12_FULL_36_13]OGI36591.1 MAG: dTDP-4-dehydrorhamnose reductase [Candidatus Moranbacteria bacterium RIFOXYA12_FULL_35_19]